MIPIVSNDLKTQMRYSMHTFTRIIFANIDYLIYKLLLPLTYSLANFCVVIMITQTDCHLLFINTTNHKLQVTSHCQITSALIKLFPNNELLYVNKDFIDFSWLLISHRAYVWSDSRFYQYYDQQYISTQHSLLKVNNLIIGKWV